MLFSPVFRRDMPRLEAFSSRQRFLSFCVGKSKKVLHQGKQHQGFLRTTASLQAGQTYKGIVETY